ncbi:MAG: ribulose-phosphate 3-epimerase [Lentisphaerae bacterium RIFOXYB12_FULL_65_16]|nr:MAG: ribulose-phosphate 3-epimerase [Lentisphaerae bacterium RIFOXYA12_64_32]OGV93833.1 MAG: ribulose-phosphate 3-epimerase [Lentisphaerae bacterium RIFOXYB12_FULL_65_16]
MTKHPLPTLPNDRITVAPSLLAADFGRLGEEIRTVEQAGAELLHIDIMDGHFVPNLSMGPPIVEKIRPLTALPFDVHLMLTNPERYIGPFSEAGADHITIHVEIEADVSDVLRRIRALGCSAGLSLRPGTPAEQLRPFLKELDLILVMTVEPGFGGQAFRDDMLPKIRTIRQDLATANPRAHLEVDGGIGRNTAGLVIDAGANMLVAGNSVFRAKEGAAAAIAAIRSAGKKS